MIVAILAFLGGALTIASPCILPVLPFVFARTGKSFMRSTLPLLIALSVTFAAVATLAAFGGAWAVRINNYGRWLALLLLTASGIALLSEHVATLLTRPIVALGNRLLSSRASPRFGDTVEALILGIATGFLWAPCAGPILGLILTGAAIQGPRIATTGLFLAYAAGAITSLGLATLAGGRVFTAMKRSLGIGELLRRGLGVLTLAAVVVIGLGWDTSVLTRLSLAETNRLEQSLVNAFRPESAMNSTEVKSNELRVEGELPDLDGAVAWLNSPPLTPRDLSGKVVLIDFWTYSCINCLRALPYVKSWYERYKDQGLVVLGVHAPEFAFEKDENNVHYAVEELGIRYPVALDNNYAIWQAFNNRYWPAHYFIDANGKIRAHHFGEGDYPESEEVIRQLLNEAGVRHLPPPIANVTSEGVQAAPDDQDMDSPETYLGYERADEFVSPGGFERGHARNYMAPAELKLNEWALAGNWQVEADKAVVQSAGGKITFRFHARDLHLVIGPGGDGKPLRFRVALDGEPPGPDRGTDVDAEGAGTVREQRLYQLIRQSGQIGDRTFTIEFLDPGAEVYSFTFG